MFFSLRSGSSVGAEACGKLGSLARLVDKSSEMALYLFSMKFKLGILIDILYSFLSYFHLFEKSTTIPTRRLSNPIKYNTVPFPFILMLILRHI